MRTEKLFFFVLRKGKMNHISYPPGLPPPGLNACRTQEKVSVIDDRIKLETKREEEVDDNVETTPHDILISIQSKEIYSFLKSSFVVCFRCGQIGHKRNQCSFVDETQSDTSSAEHRRNPLPHQDEEGWISILTYSNRSNHSSGRRRGSPHKPPLHQEVS